MPHLTAHQKEQVTQAATAIIEAIAANILHSYSIKQRQNLPTFSGVYIAVTVDNRILYVGRAQNIKSRCASGHHKIPTAIEHGAVRLLVAPVSDEILNNVENYLISTIAPPLNDSVGCWWISRTPSLPLIKADVERRAAIRAEYVRDALESSNYDTRVITDESLRGSDFSGMRLSGKYFRGADLRDCDFRGASLSSTFFRSANLAGANFDGAYLASADMQGADLTGANFTDANFREVNMRAAILTNANLTNANLNFAHCNDIDFTTVNLKGVNFQEAGITDSDFRNVNLTGLNMRGCYASDSNFTNANFTNTNLYGADLFASILDGANFTGIDLSDHGWASYHGLENK